MEFGTELRSWREARRFSQLALASAAGISARHVSFLETGRARPSQGMIIRLAETLGLPARAQNALFAAAGFAPRFPGNAVGGLQSLDASIREVIGLILERHAPWPAVCLNAGYMILGANTGFATLASGLGLAGETDLLAMVVEPGPVRDAIVGWETFIAEFIARLRADARFYGPRSSLAKRLAEIEVRPDVRAALKAHEAVRHQPPYIAVTLRIGAIETRWLTAITMLGTAQDVLAQGIFIEQYFPADDATRELAQSFGN